MKTIDSIIKVAMVIGFTLAIIFFINNKRQDDDYKKLMGHYETLDSSSTANNHKIIQLKDSLTSKDILIAKRESNITALEQMIVEILKSHEEGVEELSQLSLEEVLSYILDYYNTDSTEAEIIIHDNSIQVVIKPRLVYEWTYTLAKLESVNIELSVYKKEISEYKYLTQELKDKIGFFEQKDSIQAESLDIEKEKGSKFKELLDNRNKKIKSITLQRNIVAGVAIVVIVIVLI